PAGSQRGRVVSVISDPFAPELSAEPNRSNPAPSSLVAFALAIGVVLDIGLRGGLDNAALTVAAVLTVLLLFSGGRLVRREASIVAAASLVPALFLGIRASPWLAW